MSTRLPEALALVRDLLRAPTFPEREVARLRDERLAELLQQLRRATRARRRAVLARRCTSRTRATRCRPTAPTNTVGALTATMCARSTQARYQPSAMTLVFAGDVTMEQVAALVEPLFGDWTGTPAARPAPVARRRAAAAGCCASWRRAMRRSRSCASATSACRARTPDYFGVMVMNAVLGGLFSSRINLNLREAHGYTYGAFSAFEWRRAAGPFVVNTAVKSDVTGDAVARDPQRDRPHADATGSATDELTLATSYLDGVFPIRYETTGAIAGALASLVIHACRRTTTIATASACAP